MSKLLGKWRLFEGVPLRKGVSSIFSVATEAVMERLLPWLDAANVDDRLIAAVIDIARRHVRVPVAIVTRDTSVENKADFAGPACLYPPEPSALP
jgi:predicted ribonuclease YlaK